VAQRKRRAEIADFFRWVSVWFIAVSAEIRPGALSRGRRSGLQRCALVLPAFVGRERGVKAAIELGMALHSACNVAFVAMDLQRV
jgi:hypothetical protein